MKPTILSPEKYRSKTQERTHELKIWPSCFAAVMAGTKPFDVRENDRDFQIGDMLMLNEFEPESEQYTGQSTTRWVSYVLRGGVFGIQAGWCVIGFSEMPPLPAGIMDTKLW